jgi:hypothetical protein
MGPHRTNGTEKSVAGIRETVQALPALSRELFARILHVSVTKGQLVPCPSMNGWLEAQFGSIHTVSNQRITRITNRVTMEGSVFNALRSKRPNEVKGGPDLQETISKKVGDPFCSPLDRTPEDTFGRVKGRYCTTASSVAKFEGLHGVVVFDEHNPLVFSEESVSDYIDTAVRWAQTAHETDERAVYPLFVWNCLWKGGASIIHGHAQVVLGRDMHYAKVEGLRRAARGYAGTYGSDYFDDLYEVHEAVGLAFEHQKTRVLVYLTPIKEKEVLLISSELDQDCKASIYRVLRCFVHDLDVRSFNLAIYMRPIGKPQEEWSKFPVIVRVVDRGDPSSRTSDFGAMDLYGSSTIVSDPFQVVAALRSSFVLERGSSRRRLGGPQGQVPASNCAGNSDTITPA